MTIENIESESSEVLTPPQGPAWQVMMDHPHFYPTLLSCPSTMLGRGNLDALEEHHIVEHCIDNRPEITALVLSYLDRAEKFGRASHSILLPALRPQSYFRTGLDVTWTLPGNGNTFAEGNVEGYFDDDIVSVTPYGSSTSVLLANCYGGLMPSADFHSIPPVGNERRPLSAFFNLYLRSAVMVDDSQANRFAINRIAHRFVIFRPVEPQKHMARRYCRR